MSAAMDRGRLESVARITAAFAAEAALLDPAAPVPWPPIPTVRALVGHLGVVHRWVAEIVRTQRAAPLPEPPLLDRDRIVPWLEEGRAALLDALATVPPESPCWVLGGRAGTAAYWRRRMVFENVKHLIDLRAAGGGDRVAAPELDPDGYADGVDELFTELLPRTRPGLAPLPGAVALHAPDTGRSWRVETDWTIGSGAGAPDAAATVTARAADLALMLWERADPLEVGGRFHVEGDRAAAAALRAAPIHPW